MKGGNAVIVIAGTLLLGWLYASGRLQAVVAAIQGPGGIAAAGAAGVGAAVPGGIVPGGGPIPPVNPTPGGRASRTIEVPSAGGFGRTVRVVVMPGDPACLATVEQAFVSQGFPSVSAHINAVYQCM